MQARTRGWAEAAKIVHLGLLAHLRRNDIQIFDQSEVSQVLESQKEALPTTLQQHVERLCEISRQLRRDRELAFYGSEDLTPSEFYKEKDAKQARDNARWVVKTVAGR